MQYVDSVGTDCNLSLTLLAGGKSDRLGAFHSIRIYGNIEETFPWKNSQKTRKLLYFQNANHSAENTGNSRTTFFRNRNSWLHIIELQSGILSLMESAVGCYLKYFVRFLYKN